MLLAIPDVLTAEQVAHARRMLDAADWVDGRVTAGHQSARAKDNMQLPEGHPAARELGEMILAALGGKCIVHFRSASVARVSAAVQSISRRTIVRNARGQCDPAGERDGTSDPDGFVGDAILFAAG